MKNIKKFKTLPTFKNDLEEQEFWATHDSTDYVDWDKAQVAVFPNLKLSTKSISIRLSESMLYQIKIMANKRDVPYQSLIKNLIADRLQEEHAVYTVSKQKQTKNKKGK